MHALFLILVKAYCLLGVGDIADQFWVEIFFFFRTKTIDGKIWKLMGSSFVNNQL